MTHLGIRPGAAGLREVAILFGATADPIKQQLANQFFTARDSDVEWWQRDADAITRLDVSGLLPRSVVLATRKKLMRRIASTVRELDEAVHD